MSSSADQSQSQPRKNQGRRKVDMAKIQNESNLQVTFSKRRPGLFKKASELCTLTGAEAALVVFSPGDKAHSFGHPDVNSVVDRFLDPEQGNAPDQSVHAHARRGFYPAARQRELEYLSEVEQMVEAEKARGEELGRMRKAWEKETCAPAGADSIEGLEYEQLRRLKGAVMEFEKNLESRVGSSSNTLMPANYVVPGPRQDFGGPSGRGGVRQSAVIPYDQGASGAGAPGTSHPFSTGFGYFRGPF